MADLNGAFDSGQYEDMRGGFDPLPAGEYMAKVVESDVLPTSKKTGKYISLKFEIISGEYKGRFVWTNLNIVNPNPVTVEIAQKELATLCRACGKAVIQKTEQLHGIPIKMKLKIKPAKGDYPAGNSPVNYSPASGSGATGNGFPDETDGKKAAKDYATETPEVDGDVPWGDTPDDDDIPF